MTSSAAQKAEQFRALHRPGQPFIIPNPWDAGSARVLAGLGFQALATSSAAFALTLGRGDHGVTREEALAHSRAIAEAVSVPVSADLEDGFGVTPQQVAETVRLAGQTGLAGCSIEDGSGKKDQPIYDAALSAERIAAAVEAARGLGFPFVLTARADAFLYGQRDLDAVIARLQSFERAGADVLYAPGIRDLDALKTVCQSVSKPVNALVFGSFAPSLAEFASAGVARVSVGSTLAYSIWAGLAASAQQMLKSGEFSLMAQAAASAPSLKEFLSPQRR
jgi:2-methylisocitrate lyase-like PEP mutase family enzyme